MEKTRGFLSRRNMLFVGGGAFAAVGALLASPLKTAVSRRPRELVRARPFNRAMLSLANAGYDAWLGQVGSTFALAGAMSMSLSGVRAMDASGPRPSGMRDRAFVAEFDIVGPGSMAGDLIYTVSHPEYGAFPIFLSATDSRTPGRMLAVFN